MCVNATCAFKEKIEGEGPEEKIKFGGEGVKFKGGPKILGWGAMNPNDATVLLC